MTEIQFVIEKDKCIGADECEGTCARICPPDIIGYTEERGKKVPYITDIELCMKDHGCQNNCPVGAITILPPQEDGRRF